MDTPASYVGIDVASETFAVALTRGPSRPVGKPLAVAKDPDGFAELAAWLGEHEALPESALVCLESTGVYGEALCYALHERGYRLAVEDALKVKRAMPPPGPRPTRSTPGGSRTTPPASSTSCGRGHPPRRSWSTSGRC